MRTESNAVRSDWALSPLDRAPDDPLTGCLGVMARLLGQPMPVDILLAGLPVEGDRLTPDLFIRAAERAGLSAKVVRRTLPDISPLVLPAVLLLKDRGACVLVGSDGGGMVRVVLPESGGGERLISQTELEALHSGYAIFVRTAHRLDERSATSAIPRARHWFWGVVSQSWPIYAEVLVASLLINLFALVMPLFTMNVYDRVVPNRALESLWALAIGVGLVLLFDLMVRVLRGYFVDTAGKRIDVILSANIFERVMGIRAAARPPSVGAFASNLQEFESFREFLTSATITTLVDLPFVLLFVAAIFWVGGSLGWIVVMAIPVVLLVNLALLWPLSEVVKASFRYASQRQATLIETLVGLETIKTMRAESPAQLKWEQTIGHMASLSMRSRLLSSIGVNFSSFVQQFANLALVVAGVYLIAEDRLTTGGLIACTILGGRVLAPLAQVATLLTRYQQSMASLSSLDRMMNLPVERPADKKFVIRPRLEGAIEFRDVSFTYPGQQLPALSNLSFRIKAGERVGIIGRVGSGKTTLEKLILGLYDPDSGSVLLDGTESRQMDPAAVRRDIGYVPQDVMLFYGSVRDNIVLGNPAADDAAVLRAAWLGGVNEFVDGHPQGFDRQVGERGEGLSGGQRQAVAIARADLDEPPILLLDEPSSAMDNRSEEQLKARLKSRLGNRTLILVTHRSSLLSLVDRLIVMDQGRVVADGPKEKVLAALAQGEIRVAAR